MQFETDIKIRTLSHAFSYNKPTNNRNKILCFRNEKCTYINEMRCTLSSYEYIRITK